MPDNWIIATSLTSRGKSGLRKDTVPVNGWQGNFRDSATQKINRLIKARVKKVR